MCPCETIRLNSLIGLYYAICIHYIDIFDSFLIDVYDLLLGRVPTFGFFSFKICGLVKY